MELGSDSPVIVMANTDHALAHFRQRWYPTLIERGNYDNWLNNGGQDLGQRAAGQVERVLDEHQPETLPIDTQKQLREIVQQAVEQFG
ncbi:MAG: hypothetical protein GY759_00505 [Chloroflexi bacterium]|nr:hypothetical protein [Chloroflexota bacterium]